MPCSRQNILLNFKLKKEAAIANMNKNKRIFKWRPFWKKVYYLSNEPCKVDSNFLCYAATGLSPHRIVIIFTQRMHKPTGRQLTQ